MQLKQNLITYLIYYIFFIRELFVFKFNKNRKCKAIKVWNKKIHIFSNKIFNKSKEINNI